LAPPRLLRAFCAGLLAGGAVGEQYSPAMRALVILLFVLAAPASAQEADFHGLVPDRPGVVASVVDPLTVVLEDGRVVRLSGVHLPDYAALDPGPHALVALATLRNAFAGQAVKVYGRVVDRMGHIRAHLVTKDGGVWAQGLLLERGLAVVRTTADDARLAREMLALEARDGGVWADHPVLTPESAVSAQMPAFRVVEGVAHGVALKGNTLYVNFGPDWRTDLTLCLPGAAVRRRFSRAGADPMNWGGMRLRARGWLREYNGPFMEVDHAEAVETLVRED
jgi:micrococcal nuclease